MASEETKELCEKMDTAESANNAAPSASGDIPTNSAEKQAENSLTISDNAMTTVRAMKKDDSGISIEMNKEETTADDCLEQLDLDCSGASGESKVLSRADSSKADGTGGQDSPDSGHQDGSYSLSDFPEASAEKRPTDKESEGSPEGKKLRTDPRDAAKHKLKQTLDFLVKVNTINLEENTDSEDNVSAKSDDTCKMSSSDDEKNYDPTPQAPRPQHKWFVCQEIAKREYGYRSSLSSDLFRYNCYGSQHMVERLELMYKMKKHTGCVNSLHFNSCGSRLASGSDDLNIVIWDWTTSEPVLEYESGHRSNIFQAKFMPLSGDCHIVSCARDGQVRIAELSTTGICKGTRKLAQHRASAHKLAIEHESPHVFLSCGEDGVLFEIDLRESHPHKLLLCKEKEKKVALYTVHINPSNSYEFAIGGRNHYVRLYDKRFISNDAAMKKYCPHHLIDSDIRANVTCVVYNYDGSEVLVSYNDEDIYIFDSSHSDGAEYIHRYKGHRNSQTVKGVNYFGLRSEYIVSGSDCGYIYIWEKNSEHIVRYMHGDEGGVVNCLEPHPTCPVLATSGLDDDIKIWVPSCEDPPDMSDLKEKICHNMKEREDERKRDGPETSEVLYYLMRQLRRSARRHARSEGRDLEDSSSSNSELNSDDNDDDDPDIPHAIQCTQS